MRVGIEPTGFWAMASAAGFSRQRTAMSLRIIAGTANPDLAGAVASELGIQPTGCEVVRFPDGELKPVVEALRNDDVYLIQPTGPPVNDNIVLLLLLLDACRRAGAKRITAVVPYFGYARQDRRTRAGEPVGAAAVAAALAACGAGGLLLVDPHSVALEAMFRVPVEALTAVPLLVDALVSTIPDDTVIVAPDLGAAGLAGQYASLLKRPLAVVRKTRITGATVQAEEVIGEVEGRPVLIIDDMISTGGTIEAAVHALLENGALPNMVVAATHGVLVGAVSDRFRRLPLRRVLVTDTLAAPDDLSLPFEIVTIGPLLADAVLRLNQQHSREPIP